MGAREIMGFSMFFQKLVMNDFCFQSLYVYSKFAAGAIASRANIFLSFVTISPRMPVFSGRLCADFKIVCKLFLFPAQT